MQRLTDPPTNNRFKKLVQKGLLKNVYYVHDSTNFKLKKDQEEYVNQFDPAYVHFKKLKENSDL